LLLGGGEALVRLMDAPAWLFAVGIAMVFGCWGFNTARVRVMLTAVGRPLPFRDTLGIVMATDFAICATLSALVPLGLYLLWQPGGHLAWPFFALGVLLILGLFLTWALGRWYRPILLLGGRLLRHLRVSPQRRRRLARGLLRFRATLRFMLSLPRTRLLLLYSLCVGHWLLRYSILALLAPYLDPPTLAATLLLWRFFTYWWYLIAGAPAFVHLAGRSLWRRLAGRVR